jgi:RNA polymerase sigma factor (sigma-70 family)
VPSPDLNEFCEAEWPRLVGALSLYTGDADLAQDLAQEAIVRVCRHWRRVRQMEAPGAWLHRVARNLAHSHYRRLGSAARARRRSQTADEHSAPPDESVVLRALVSSLPERERDAIVLRFYVGCSVRETAGALGVPEGTVKTLTHRAVARLRAAGAVDPEVVDA